MKIKIYSSLIILLFFLFFESFSQTSNELWRPINNLNNIASKKTIQENEPLEFKLFELDLELLKKKLSKVPKSNSKNKLRTIINFPNEIGILQRFEVYESSIMEEGLQNKFPNIKSYKGKSIDNPGLLIRFSITTQGLNSIILNGPNSTIYIEPYFKNKKQYKVFSINSITKPSDFDCGYKDIKQSAKKNINPTITNQNKNFRTVKIAIAVTGEYSNFHLTNSGISPNKTDFEKKEVVLSAIVATMTNVNAVFERDVSLTLELIENSDKIIFLDSDTDGLTGDDKNKLLDEGKIIVKEVIGLNNYNISHVYSGAISGGVAYQTPICGSDKPNGVSGTYTPMGYGFLNVIMHEIGHQFGANHTYNKCSYFSSDFPISEFSSMEPGSGSTIMSYGGVCWEDDNVVNKSDNYFHGISIQQMISKLSLESSGCLEIEPIDGEFLEINDIKNYTIPISTPFELEGSVSNIDSSNFTYTWEQFDPEPGSSPPTKSQTKGPIFRSFPPKNSSKRQLPSNLSNEFGEVSNTWEVIPSISRTVKFGLTVRNNNLDFPLTAFKQIEIKFDKDSGPFKVTSQEYSETWNVGEIETVTWDVASTDKLPILCSKVNILFFDDIDSSSPIVLASEIENNGSFDITVPDLSTSGGKIKVVCVDNIFYSFNKGFISINPPTDKTFVPDNELEQYLIDYRFDEHLDNYIFKTKAKEIKKLNLTGRNILNLTGIEDFENLIEIDYFSMDIKSIDLSNKPRLKNVRLSGSHLNELNFDNSNNLIKLRADYNNLTDIDVSKLKLLEKINLAQNNINSIDLSANTKLTEVILNNNSIEDIDVSNLKLLKKIDLTNNKINLIDISNNLMLEEFFLSKNSVKSLDITKNTLLKKLDISEMDITSLDISNNNLLESLNLYKTKISSLIMTNYPFLTNLNLYETNLTSFDFSTSTEIRYLEVSYSQLKELDVTKMPNLVSLSLNTTLISSLDLSKNFLLERLNVNKSLELKCIQVNEYQFNEIPNTWYNYGNIPYSINCSDPNYVYVNDNDYDNDGVLNDIDLCEYTPSGEVVNDKGCSSSQITSIPDENFEEALIALKIDSDGIVNNQVLSKDVLNVLSLDIREKGIKDITGIEAFKSLKNLNLNNNQLINIDISKNTKLTTLSCSNNELVNIDVSKNTELINLDCSKNKLKNINVSENTKLDLLFARNNQITDINLNRQIELTNLDFSSNLLTSIDVSKNRCLTSLNLNNNQLVNIDVSKNTELINLHLGNNELTNVDFSNNLDLLFLYCPANQLTSIDLSSNSKLERFYFFNNPYLECIQVLDATAAKESEGIYKFWEKNSESTYREDCSDSDSDGVLNENDLCPNTPENEEVNEVGCSDNQSLNINDILLQDILIYPNPISESLSIRSKANKIIKVEFYSFLGIKIKEINSNFNLIKINDLSAGLYAVKIYSEIGNTIRKIVKK